MPPTGSSRGRVAHGSILSDNFSRCRVNSQWQSTLRPPFRFKRGLSGRQAHVSLGLRAKRNETGVFQGVTRKAQHLAPPKTVSNRRDPFNINGLIDALFWVETVFLKYRSPHASYRTLQICRPHPSTRRPSYKFYNLSREFCLAS